MTPNLTQKNPAYEDSVIILTGAGISRESGLETFRDAGGVWSRIRLEDVATPEAFRRDPAQVHDFYNARRRQLRSPEITPNPAHRALARLEAGLPGQVLLITQNVDDLHDRAGSRNLIHMHGELFRVRCEKCEYRLDWFEDLSVTDACPACGQAGGLRPDIVWFGEMPQAMDRIAQTLAACRLFIAIGTSAQVYPAAAFVDEARRAGAHTVELNLEASDAAYLFSETRYGPASLIVPAYVDEILAGTAKFS